MSAATSHVRNATKFSPYRSGHMQAYRYAILTRNARWFNCKAWEGISAARSFYLQSSGSD